MRTRLELHEILCEILGSDQCYFSPPGDMLYPCIVYHYEGIQTYYADNKRYLNSRVYSVTVIDEDPDSEIPNRLFKDERLKYLDAGSVFVADGLYHFPYKLHF